LNFDNIISDLPFPEFNRQWFNKRIDIINNDVSRCQLYLCANQSKTLSANLIAGADYVWSKDGTVITTATSSTLEVTETGYYEVFVEPNNGSCPIEGRATVLESNDIPTAQNTDLVQCDDDTDGLTTFNLSLLNETVSNNEANRTVRYYANLVDLNAEINELNSSNFENTTNPQTLYALVISTENGCTAQSEVNLSVSVTAVADFELSGCDTDDLSDGFASFNLTDAASQILSDLPSGLNITFHETYDHALTASFPLDSNYTNTVAYNQTLFARIINGLDCFGISEIDLTVYDLPTLEDDSELLYCLNNAPETITITSGITGGNLNNYAYLWSTDETTSQIEVNEIGTYSVVVTNENGCSSQRFITVVPSNIAMVTAIEVNDVSTNNSIRIFVTGEGDYEYALNDVSGPYQDSHSFFDLQPGIYTVFVRDKNNCGIINEMVSILGFPKFFTPNEDGVNDTWQIKGMTPANQINSPILIFNRYGKLLIELSPLSPGWDGTLNGTKLPSSDYWFKVTLNDGRILNSHFTLKR
jgi:gliding motility-associated-like protein